MNFTLFVYVLPIMISEIMYFKQEWKTNLITEAFFVLIMSSTDKDSILAISKFLVSAFSHRSALLQTET